MDGIARFCNFMSDLIRESTIIYSGTDIVHSNIIGVGMASIAIFNDFAIIETEQIQGPARKYVLRSN